MTSSLTSLLLTAFLMVALAASLWSFFQSGGVHTGPHPRPMGNQPDAWMENVSAVILNEFGKPALGIKTPRLAHYSGNDTTRIQKPEVTFYRNSPEPWHINAEEGIATHGIGNILFSTHVTVHHAADRLNPEILLKTESLTLLPDQNEANTQERVTITQPDAMIDAKGMSANLNTGIIHLLSDTRSEYVPAS